MATGIPLRFAYATWAGPFMRFLGGPGSAGFIHRVCAAITFGYFFIHLAAVTRTLIRTDDKQSIFWGPRSMVPQPKDVRDVVAHVQVVPRPRTASPSSIATATWRSSTTGRCSGAWRSSAAPGLLLWFPTLFARFLPGWLFNIATIVHGDEALLALGFIFTIHFFNVHLRPEKFPIDLVIFTGRARAEYFEDEHPLEYERNRREGRLGALQVEAPSRATYLWSIGLGFAALAVGVFLVLLVIYALLS